MIRREGALYPASLSCLFLRAARKATLDTAPGEMSIALANEERASR
jgi:hypothetical protein